MDPKAMIAAVPWLRRLWRFLPGPLRIPVLAIGVVIWWFRRGGDEGPDTEGPAATTDG